jgi:myo-inositol catabolism protein IolS
MRYRPIPRTDLQLSEIGFGCWTMGGPNWNLQTGQPVGWANVNEEDVLAGIKAGLDHGVNHWDNADIYGNGLAERRLGSAFRKLGVARDPQVIATKVGHFRGTAANAFEPTHIRRQCEQSLKNLRVDHIDLYYFHHGTFTGPDYDGQSHDYLHEAAGTMHALVKEGKVKAIGQSAYSVEDFARAIPIVRPNILQSKANLRTQDLVVPGGPLLKLMKDHDCAFVAFGPLDQGILLDKFDPEHPPRFEGEYRENRKDFNPEILRLVRAKLAKAHDHFASRHAGKTRLELFSSIAQRWLLAHERVCSVIPGFRNASQASCNVAAATDEPMAPEDVAWLRELFR